jgi:hypothetical protein
VSIQNNNFPVDTQNIDYYSARMAGPQRKPDQTAISVSMSKTLLEQLDARAEALGLNRSQYLVHLARQDLASKGALILQEHPTKYEISSDRKAEIAGEALNVAKQGLTKTKGKTSPAK